MTGEKTWAITYGGRFHKPIGTAINVTSANVEECTTIDNTGMHTRIRLSVENDEGNLSILMFSNPAVLAMLADRLSDAAESIKEGITVVGGKSPIVSD